MITKNLESSIRKTNGYGMIILATMIAINLYIALYLQGRSLPHGTIRMILLCAGMGTSSLLLKYANYKVSAFITILSIFAAFFLYPILPVNSKPAEDLFLLLFLLLIASVLPYKFYQIDKDKLWIVGWLVLMIGTFIYSFNYSLQVLDEQQFGDLKLLFRYEPMLLFAYFSALILLHIIIFSYSKGNHDARVNLLQTNEHLTDKLNFISKQKEILIDQKEELEHLQEELQTIQERLEVMVRRRTKKLEQQNESLKKYGFINAKLLREPIIELMRLVPGTFASKHVADPKVEKTIQQLDNITLAISEILNNSEPEKSKAIEKRIRKYLKTKKNDGRTA